MIHLRIVKLILISSVLMLSISTTSFAQQQQQVKVKMTVKKPVNTPNLFKEAVRAKYGINEEKLTSIRKQVRSLEAQGKTVLTRKEYEKLPTNARKNNIIILEDIME